MQLSGCCRGVVGGWVGARMLREEERALGVEWTTNDATRAVHAAGWGNREAPVRLPTHTLRAADYTPMLHCPGPLPCPTPPPPTSPGLLTTPVLGGAAGWSLWVESTCLGGSLGRVPEPPRLSSWASPRERPHRHPPAAAGEQPQLTSAGALGAACGVGRPEEQGVGGAEAGGAVGRQTTGPGPQALGRGVRAAGGRGCGAGM